MDSRLTVRDTTWDQTKSSECVTVVSCCLENPRQWDQDLPWVHEWAFCSPFPMVEQLDQIYIGRQSWFCLKLVYHTLYSPKGRLTNSEEWMGNGMGRGRWWKRRRKCPLEMVCKMKKTLKKRLRRNR